MKSPPKRVCFGRTAPRRIKNLFFSVVNYILRFHVERLLQIDISGLQACNQIQLGVSKDT